MKSILWDESLSYDKDIERTLKFKSNNLIKSSFKEFNLCRNLINYFNIWKIIEYIDYTFQ